MSEWKIEFRRNTFVPGRFAPVTHGDWWVIVNPHGGIQAFYKTKQDAETHLVQVRRESYCQCQWCLEARKSQETNP